METKIMLQGTPNPNALKFVVNKKVIDRGNVTYKSEEECNLNPLARKVFEISNQIKEVYFFDNYITVTKSNNIDWEDIEDEIKSTILENIKSHDINFEIKKEETVVVSDEVANNPEIAKINAILNKQVRPALQLDGGDVQVTGYSDNVVTIFYEGACGSCPSSSMGTMQAIENMLKNEFNPKITVKLEEAMI